jgi:uncharacterized protein (DUF486 family)
VQNPALRITQYSKLETARILLTRAPGSIKSCATIASAQPAGYFKPIGRFVSSACRAASYQEHILTRQERENMRTIILLTISNIFMTFAWYGHLKYRSSALWKVILVSWGIAFFEYCFQVPANRIGSYEFSAAQLKTIQEVITLTVFSVFSVLYLGEKIKWNYAAGFGCIALAVFFVFHKW